MTYHFFIVERQLMFPYSSPTLALDSSFILIVTNSHYSFTNPSVNLSTSHKRIHSFIYSLTNSACSHSHFSWTLVTDFAHSLPSQTHWPSHLISSHKYVLSNELTLIDHRITHQLYYFTQGIWHFTYPPITCVFRVRLRGDFLTSCND